MWVVAGVTVVVVLGLVAALVITNSSSREDTVVEPMPSLQPTTPAPRAPSPTRTPSPTPVPPPPTTPPTTTTTAPAATETVVYEVTGPGRAINITYVDTGRLLQTEFNVLLPWRKEVALPNPAEDVASITVINIGRDITCSVSVDGAQVATRTGSGLTICTPR